MDLDWRFHIFIFSRGMKGYKCFDITVEIVISDGKF